MVRVTVVSLVLAMTVSAPTGNSAPLESAKCEDAFDGGAKGPALGCVGKLEAQETLEKPKTLCAVTGDLGILEAAVDAFVANAVDAILDRD